MKVDLTSTAYIVRLAMLHANAAPYNWLDNKHPDINSCGFLSQL